MKTRELIDIKSYAEISRLFEDHPEAWEKVPEALATRLKVPKRNLKEALWTRREEVYYLTFPSWQFRKFFEITDPEPNMTDVDVSESELAEAREALQEYLEAQGDKAADPLEYFVMGFLRGRAFKGEVEEAHPEAVTN